MNLPNHCDSASQSRREMLRRCGAGIGLLALGDLLQVEGLGAPARHNPISVLPNTMTEPMSPRPTHFPPRARRVIWLFMNGGQSQVDTWDYKPELQRRHGQTVDGFDRFTGFFADQVGGLMASPFSFKAFGQSGKHVSDLFPHLASQVDKMAFIHSGHSESNNHSPALFMMNCGLPRMGFPCIGSWVTYGLGSENQNLPSFVVMSDPKDRGLPKGHASNWSAGFLPGVFQGTWLKPRGDAIEHLHRLPDVSDVRQRGQLDLLQQLNQSFSTQLPNEADLNARVKSYELAYAMQMAAPEALAIRNEPKHIQRLYGLDLEHCGHFAAQCLMARRLAERGVRYIQIYSGGNENQKSWDGHNDIEGNHRGFARETDQPIAGLLQDLNQRGLLEDTLVVCCGEFGRLPIAQKSQKPGRDHNPHCFTAWLAGGGIRGGVTYGASDEIGFRAAQDPVHINDLHATILHSLGLDHERLTYRHNGRDFRLTDVGGSVIRPILS